MAQDSGPLMSGNSSAVQSIHQSRIQCCFKELGARGERALIAFVTAGDPDLDTTRRMVLALAAAGADIIELGVPFSDPLLDGPVIQAASQRSLDQGTRVSQIFELVEKLRSETRVPLIFMTCLNPIHRMGLRLFARRAQEVGVDGILVTDLPPEEGNEWIGIAQEHNLDRILMLAPTSSAHRIREVAAAATGFIYCQSRAGVTGFQQSVPADLGDLIRRVRAASPLPIGVGFGISTPDHVRAVTKVAEGAAVGTAFVRLIAENVNDPDKAVEAVADLAARLKAAARG